MTYTPLSGDAAAPKPASEHTRAANARVLEELPFEDRRSFENAQRGFIATIDPLIIHRDG